MPPQNHGGPRTPPTPYNAQFDATYNPSGLQTNMTWGGGGSGRGGGGRGGYGYDSESSFDLGGLMDTVYNYKQRAAEAAFAREKQAAEAALARQQGAARDERHRASFQAQALRNQMPAETSKTRQFYTNKMDLDKTMASDPWAGRGYGQTQGLNYANMPAASALTYGQDIFPNGWDQYAKLITPVGRK